MTHVEKIRNNHQWTDFINYAKITLNSRKVFYAMDKNKLELQRLNLLIRLGEGLHLHFRNENVSIDELKVLSDELVRVDSLLAKFNENYIIPEKLHICDSCATELNVGDTFCGSCGAKVEEKIETPVSTCASCGFTIDRNSKFCAMCGFKTEKTEE